MTHTCRPSTRPCPVTTPSAGVPSGDGSAPRTGCCSASRPSSTNVSLSNSRSIRSRTVSLPRSCCLAIRCSPPMARFFFLRPRSSATRSPKSSLIATPLRILWSASVAAGQQVGSLPPAVEKTVEIALRQPVPLRGRRPLPQPVFVAGDGKIREGQRPAASIAQPKAEVDVGDPVEAELRIHSLDRQRIRTAKGHAVALDRIDLRSRALRELLDGCVDRPKTERSDYDDVRILERGKQGADRVAGELDALVAQDARFAGGRLDSGVDSGRKTGRWVESQDAQTLCRSFFQPPGDARVARVVDDQRLEIRLAGVEDRDQPALRVGLPAVHHREQGD